MWRWLQPGPNGAQYYSGMLGEYWALLGEYWALLGEYWALLGEYWAPLGEYWALLGEYWALLGEYWAPLGEGFRVLGLVVTILLFRNSVIPLFRYSAFYSVPTKTYISCSNVCVMQLEAKQC